MELNESQLRKALANARNACKDFAPLTDEQLIVIWDKIKEQFFGKEVNIPFDTIWDVYKKTNHTRKREAEVFWKKMSNKKRELAYSKVKEFLNYKPFENYRHPALVVYLNKERWEDVQDPTVMVTGSGFVFTPGYKSKYEKLI